MPIASTMAAATVVFVSDCRIASSLMPENWVSVSPNSTKAGVAKPGRQARRVSAVINGFSTTEAVWRIRLSTVRGMMLMQEPAAVQANIA